MRELLPGHRRFSELLRGLPGITPNLLAKRLAHLARSGVARQLPSPDRRGGPWALTRRGRSLEPVILGLGAFGADWMENPTDQHTSGRWFIVSLKRRYRGGCNPSTLGVRIDGEPYTLFVTDERLDCRDGWPAEADATVSGSLPAVASFLTQGKTGAVADVETAGVLEALTAFQGCLTQGTGGNEGPISAEAV